ncbi:hypothetical protein D3C73_1665470 [compost metagenome]
MRQILVVQVVGRFRHTLGAQHFTGEHQLLMRDVFERGEPRHFFELIGEVSG